MTSVSRAAKRSRYYIVKDKSGASAAALVKAQSPQAAINAVTGDKYETIVPSQEDLVKMITVDGVKPIDATIQAEEPAPADKPVADVAAT